MEKIAFKSAAAFRKWLAANHAQVDGIWLHFYKIKSGHKSITYAEALDEALCHGWIDGQRLGHDVVSYLQKFTPRRARSGWSKLNTQHVERLTKADRMHSAGLKAVAAAKADGRWLAAYDSARNAAPPPDFLAALNRDKKAKAFFATLIRANVYAIVYRLQTAKKPETRARRMKLILEMLSRGKKFH